MIFQTESAPAAMPAPFERRVGAVTPMAAAVLHRAISEGGNIALHYSIN